MYILEGPYGGRCSANSRVEFFHLFSYKCFPLTGNQTKKQEREVCVTVGLSSEVYLVPNANKICDFWLFLG